MCVPFRTPPHVQSDLSVAPRHLAAYLWPEAEFTRPRDLEASMPGLNNKVVLITERRAESAKEPLAWPMWTGASVR